ncbi:hypothetical protein MLD38_031524 [Melastoma candidum]|uniref:Uncharacterized protein n=1 Tax=Melastoma candidum TaxID=119954 RepID=A0ACB9MR76_9MYRT|nr:hypothetical protein MLD38_031524 [Melastoma candidum]
MVYFRSEAVREGTAKMDRDRAPKGHFVVYVGNEDTRHVVPLFYLDCPRFRDLLDKAADEYGHNSNSRIVLPCDSGTFSRVMASGKKAELKEGVSQNCRHLRSLCLRSN